MLKTALFTLLVCCACLPAGAQRWDTIAIQKRISQLQNTEQISKYLNELLAADARYRSTRARDSIDIAHLIAAACLVNTIGYPARATFGQGSVAPWAIWIHNKSELKRYCFPIILKAYLSREIPEKDLREYYLRTLYQSEFADEDFRTMPLPELFQRLRLNLSKRVDIGQLIRIAEQQTTFLQLPREIVGRWQMPGVNQQYNLNGRTWTTRTDDSTVEIFKVPDGRLFFYEITPDNSCEPREIQTKSANQWTFKDERMTLRADQQSLHWTLVGSWERVYRKIE
jgi:hypothetical protein